MFLPTVVCSVLDACVHHCVRLFCFLSTSGARTDYKIWNNVECQRSETRSQHTPFCLRKRERKEKRTLILNWSFQIYFFMSFLFFVVPFFFLSLFFSFFFFSFSFFFNRSFWTSACLILRRDGCVVLVLTDHSFDFSRYCVIFAYFWASFAHLYPLSYDNILVEKISVKM